MPTAIQPRITEGPGGGLVVHLDPRHVPELAWSRGRNIRFPTGKDRVQKTDGYRQLDVSVPAEPVQALWWYYYSLGGITQELVRIGTTSAWTGFGPTRALIATMVPTSLMDVVTVVQYKNYLIWANGAQVMLWNGTGQAIDMPDFGKAGGPGLADVGRIVEVHKQHILIGHLTHPSNKPFALNYSVEKFTSPINEEPGTPDFSGISSGQVLFLDDGAAGITAMKVMGEHVIVHKPSRIYRMVFVGPPAFYTYEAIPADEGSLSPRGAISVGSYQYFIGRSNFYRLGAFTEPIGDAIWPEIEDAMDWNRFWLTYAYRRVEFNEICWKIPTKSAAQPSLTAVFNTREQTWSLTDHDPGTAFTEIPGYAIEAIPPPSTSLDSVMLSTVGQNIGFVPDAASIALLDAPVDTGSVLLFAAGQNLGYALGPVTPTEPPPVPGLEIPPVRAIFGQDDGDIHLYEGVHANGDAFTAWVESRHMTDELAPAKILAIPVFATGTGTLWVQLRSAMELRQPMPHWPEIPPESAKLLLDASQTRPWIDVRGYGRLWQVRLESTGRDDYWEVSAYGTAVIPGGYAR